MSDTDITPTAVDGNAVATEGVENSHAVDHPNVMIAGEPQICTQCANYAQELTIANERYDALSCKSFLLSKIK